MRPQLESLPGASDSLTVAQLADYVQRQLQNIAASVTGLYEGEGEVSNRAPTKPREGLYAWADGTNWNPAGVGKGPVVYDGSAYRALYSTPAALLTAIKTVDGAGSGLDSDTLDALDSSYFLNAGNLSAGTLPAARMPALTGDVTTSLGAVATTIGANKVTLGMMAQLATGTVLGRLTAGTGNVEALTTLPAVNGSNLTNLNAANISSGRIPSLRLPALSTYTPTYTAVANITGTTGYATSYIDLGDWVVAFGQVDIQVTATATATLRISLPIASAMTQFYDGAGSFIQSGGTQSGGISAEPGTDTMQVSWAATIGTHAFFFLFAYRKL